MPIIDPSGLFTGKRLRRCSDGARLRWAYYFLASNGFARFELDPDTVRTVFVDFKTPVSTETFWSDMQEYRDNFLLFVYQDRHGRFWGQWDCRAKWLSKYKTKADQESPEPPAEAFQQWITQYQQVSEVPESFQKFSKISENSPLGIGIGKGIGVGVGGGVAAKKPPQAPVPLTLTEWGKPDADELAQRLASELVPLHWFPSDERLSMTHLRFELATAVNPDSAAMAIRSSHERWRSQVDQARLSSSLPKKVANKALEWWVKDRLYTQEPRFGATRIEQAASSSKPGVSRTIARLLASGEEQHG